MKRIVSFVILLVMLLTACGRQTPRTVYQDDRITVQREGRNTTITDTLTAGAYSFTTRRVRKPQTAEAAAQRAVFQTAADTDTLRILTVRDCIIIHEKISGKYVLVK